MDKYERASKVIELSQKDRQEHRDALWEEEKHFAWWISIIFPILIFIYSHSELTIEHKAVIVTLGSLIGIFMAYTGYHVVRREGTFFKIAHETFIDTYKELGLDGSPESHKEPDEQSKFMSAYSSGDDFIKVEKKANKSVIQLALGVFQPKTLSIRDWFQLIFIVAGFNFFILCILIWLTFWNIF